MAEPITNAYLFWFEFDRLGGRWLMAIVLGLMAVSFIGGLMTAFWSAWFLRIMGWLMGFGSWR